MAFIRALQLFCQTPPPPLLATALHMQFELYSHCGNDMLSHANHFICRMQLAVDVQIPQEFGGLGGEAIYIGKSKNCVY